MSKIYYGCDELTRGWGHYFKECNAIELDLEQLDAMPRIATLNRWRVESPRGFGFLLTADSRFIKALVAAGSRAQAEVSEELRAAWQANVERAHALAARAIIIRTPPEFSPGPRSREMLTAFTAELAAPIKPVVIWQSDGLWQLRDTREFAHSIGLVYAYDPFIAQREGIEFTHGDTAWVITERAGQRRRFDQFDMETLIDWADSYDRVFCLMRGRFKWEHAREMKVALDYNAP